MGWKNIKPPRGGAGPIVEGLSNAKNGSANVSVCILPAIPVTGSKWVGKILAPCGDNESANVNVYAARNTCNGQQMGGKILTPLGVARPINGNFFNFENGSANVSVYTARNICNGQGMAYYGVQKFRGTP